MSDQGKYQEEAVQALRQVEDQVSSPPQARERQAALDHADAQASDLNPNRVTVDQVRAHPHTQVYLAEADEHLKLIGYTEHGFRHASLVSAIAANVLARLDYPQRQGELAAIAGILHDIGNVVNRHIHGQMGALMAKDLLLELGMEMQEIVMVMAAIGNHEQERGHAISPVAAALILADKADVHRSRVHNQDRDTFDIHDRVNYAATHSFLRVEPESQSIKLELTIDIRIASVMDYFEIFLSRMIMCRRAAEFLGCTFHLEINGNEL